MISRSSTEPMACNALNISPITTTAAKITAILPAIGRTLPKPQCLARRMGFTVFFLFMFFPPA